MEIRSHARTMWLFVLRFAALIALSVAVLAGVSMARNETSATPVPVNPETELHIETALA